MAEQVSRIGDLRWPIIIARREQTSDGPGGSSLTETLVDVMQVRADIQPVGALTYYGGVQTDRPITHRVRLRWLDWLDETHVFVRRTYRADLSVRTEIFRIRRVKEVQGRKRFIEVECEQESRA